MCQVGGFPHDYTSLTCVAGEIEEGCAFGSRAAQAAKNQFDSIFSILLEASRPQQKQQKHLLTEAATRDKSRQLRKLTRGWLKTELAMVTAFHDSGLSF